MTVQVSLNDTVSPEMLRRRGTSKWNKFDADVLALWVAEMDYAVAPVVRSAVQDAVDREEFGYARAAANKDLSEATALWSRGRYDWQIDPERVHVLPDVLKGVEIAIEFFSPPGAPIILTTPAYMPFFEIPKVVRRPAIEVPMAVDQGRFVLDLDEIDRAFRSGAHTLVLCNPYNPLGRLFTAEELRALSEVVARNGGRVVSDEIHAPLTYGRRHVPYASNSDVAAAHSITLVSASKGWNLPGLKCAQAIVTNDADEARWHEIPQLVVHGASTIGIDANIAAYRLGGVWLDETLVYLDGNRRHLAELITAGLPGVNYVPPEATYLAWLDFHELELPSEPADFFLERARVAMNPGAAFGSDSRHCARLNFATSRAILERAITAMSQAVVNR